jgi:hypothetical protein
MNWPRVAGGDSIEPPVSGGKPAGDAPTDGGSKVAPLFQVLHHAAD